MNSFEADVCMQMQLPVCIKQPKEYQTAKHYKIVSLHKCRDNHLNKTYIRTAGLSAEEAQRTSFTEPIENLEVMPEFKGILWTSYRQLRYITVKKWVSEMLKESENKTTLTAKLKKMIDEIKKE